MKNLWGRNSFLWFLVTAFLVSISNGDAVASVANLKNSGSETSPISKASAADLSDFYLAQNPEVTINLEKRMPSQSEIDQQVVSRAAEVKTENSPKQVNPAVSPVDQVQAELAGEKSDIVPGTVELAEGEDSFDDMEDPFAEEEAIPVQSDPLEGYNRWMYSVNESIYDYFMEPVARGYRAVLHENIRLSIRNVFDNALSPVKFVSSAIQGDLDKSARVLSRLVLNTTVGLGGIFDVAGEGYGVDNVNEDMDQAMGFHGVPTGPYLVLPFFGPSSARDFTGRIFDSLLSPVSYFSPSFLVGAGITVEERTNAVSFIIDDKKAIDDSALDEYESVRDFYYQYREGLVAK